MIPINQYKFYDLGAKLYRVMAHKSAVNAGEMFVPLMEAQAALDALIKGDPITLDFAKPEANALLGKLGTLFNRYFIDLTTRQFRFPSREEVIDGHELMLLRSLVEKFETALAAELSRRAIYAVSRHGLFDTRDLAEHAELQFDEQTLARMPDNLREEIRMAGRSLAFGLGTATCFHLLRAVEGAMALYMQNFSRQPATSSDGLWKEVLQRLGSAEKDKFISADARLGGLLRDVDGRYRAALAKPGASFSTQEASVFFGIFGSLMTLLMESLSERRPSSRPKEAVEIEEMDEEEGVDAA